MAKDRELPPPLEMMCLNSLWEIGEGNVEEVRRLVSRNRPLAYTTVLTLLDRLARRGAVSRRKEGRGFRYQPTVDRDKLRRMALGQFLEYHFEGSEAKLRIFLEQPVELTPEQATARPGIAVESRAPIPAEPAIPAATPQSAFAATASGDGRSGKSSPEA